MGSRSRRRLERGGEADRTRSPSTRQPSTGPGKERPWKAVDGSEQVILGDLSILADGGPVEVVPADAAKGVADSDPGTGPPPVTLARKR